LGWLLSYGKKPQNSHHNRAHHPTACTERTPIYHGKGCSGRFFADSNGRHCAQHPFGCGNALVLNWDDMGVGLCLRLCSFVQNELACYTMMPMDLMVAGFVLLQGSMQRGVMTADWMTLSSRLRMSPLRTTTIALCIIFFIITMDMPQHLFFPITAE